MVEINSGRMTHEHHDDLVVFLIGMRINKWWRPDLWLPVFFAMPTMLRELSKDPNSGFLGYRLLFGESGAMTVQYWASHDQLHTYANDTAATHRPAWAAFNRRAKKAPGAVGIWHETYEVSAAESMYVGMPSSGLADATNLVPVTGRLDRARDRYSEGVMSS